MRLGELAAEQSAGNEAADLALRRPSRHKRSGKHKRDRCPRTRQMENATAEKGVAGAATMSAFGDAVGANDVASGGAEVRAAASKELVEEASAAVVSSVVKALNTPPGDYGRKIKTQRN